MRGQFGVKIKLSRSEFDFFPLTIYEASGEEWPWGRETFSFFLHPTRKANPRRIRKWCSGNLTLLLIYWELLFPSNLYLVPGKCWLPFPLTTNKTPQLDMKIVFDIFGQAFNRIWRVQWFCCAYDTVNMERNITIWVDVDRWSAIRDDQSTVTWLNPWSDVSRGFLSQHPKSPLWVGYDTGWQKNKIFYCFRDTL